MSTQVLAEINTFEAKTSDAEIKDYKTYADKLNYSAPSEDPTSFVRDIDQAVSLKSKSTSAEIIGFSTQESKYQSKLLAEWNGYVTEVSKDGEYFAASLQGIRGEGVKDEEDDALIPISDVSKSDMALLKPGNYFRLCVMHEVNKAGQPRRYTQLVFRRLPAYRKQDLDYAEERGRELARGLRVE
jgi:hypothetical protein